MTLFGGLIAQRVNKQDTVTTLSTEVELLALSQTTKKAIFLSRLFKAITLRLYKPLIIDYNNTQTLRLIKEDIARLIIKLRHINIYRYQLRQKYTERRVLFQQKLTKKIIANSLTKALPRQKFNTFVKIIGMVDIKERLNAEKRMEDLKDKLLVRRKDSDLETEIMGRLTD